jgi:hypothetical protein
VRKSLVVFWPASSGPVPWSTELTPDLTGLANRRPGGIGCRGDEGIGVHADYPDVPLLFDKCIGRKRDVGGGVLAGLWLAGFGF